MKPSELLKRELGRNVLSPFGDTLGRAELEQAAAMIVLACSRNGDTWAGLEIELVVGCFERAADAGEQPWERLRRMPVFRPEFLELVRRGFATRGPDPEARCALTERGLYLLEHPSAWRNVEA